jgi:hypothetical protein
MLCRPSSRGSETGGKAEAIVRSDYCWRLNAATLIADCGLLNHALSGSGGMVASVTALVLAASGCPASGTGSFDRTDPNNRAGGWRKLKNARHRLPNHPHWLDGRPIGPARASKHQPGPAGLTLPPDNATAGAPAPLLTA